MVLGQILPDALWIDTSLGAEVAPTLLGLCSLLMLLALGSQGEADFLVVDLFFLTRCFQGGCHPEPLSCLLYDPLTLASQSRHFLLCGYRLFY